jgi:hypothetical protein
LAAHITLSVRSEETRVPASVGFLRERIVHVHLTTLCNLACVHCYSSSGPGTYKQLAVDQLLRGLTVLRAEGYEVVSLSGGEPLLFRGLPDLIAAMKGLGYRVNVVTNGTVFNSSQVRAAVSECSFTAVSIDGSAGSHDRIRGRGAFDRTTQGLRWLADAELPFGITSTVTHTSLREIPEVYNWAVGTGARLLSLRPLAMVGRAATDMGSAILNQGDLARIFVLANLLDQQPPGIRVHTDVVPVELIAKQRATAYPTKQLGNRLSDLVNPIIVSEQGQLMPYAYGVSDLYNLGSICQADEAVERFRANGDQCVRSLLDAAFEDLPISGCVDWHSHLTNVSIQLGQSHDSPQAPTNRTRSQSLETIKPRSG